MLQYATAYRRSGEMLCNRSYSFRTRDPVRCQNAEKTGTFLLVVNFCVLADITAAFPPSRAVASSRKGWQYLKRLHAYICQRPGFLSPRSHRDTTSSEHTGDGRLAPDATNTGLWDVVLTPHVHRHFRAKTQAAGSASVQICRLRTRKLANEGCFGTIDRYMENPGLREGQTCRATYNESSAEAGKRFLRRQQGNGIERDWAGSPSILVICGRSRQTSARQNQRKA